MKFLRRLLLIVCLCGANPPGKPAVPTWTKDNYPVVREGRLYYIFVTDDKKDGDISALVYYTFTDPNNKYRLSLPRGKNRTMFFVDGKQYLPDEASTYVAKHPECLFQLSLVEAGEDDEPMKSWWRVDIVGPKKD